MAKKRKISKQIHKFNLGGKGPMHFHLTGPLEIMEGIEFQKSGLRIVWIEKLKGAFEIQNLILDQFDKFY